MIKKTTNGQTDIGQTDGHRTDGRPDGQPQNIMPVPHVVGGGIKIESRTRYVIVSDVNNAILMGIVCRDVKTKPH